MPGLYEDDDDELQDPERRLPTTGEPAQTPQPAPPVTLRGISPQLQQRTSQDEAKSQDLAKGSGISQIKSPIGRGILRGLDALGSAVLPGPLSRIPGTELHHQELVGQNNRALDDDYIQQGRDIQTATTQAKTPVDIAHTQAETNALNNPQTPPKEEKWDTMSGYTDTDETPLLHEQNSGTVVRASDKKPPTGFKVSTPPKPTTTRDVTRIVGGQPHTIMVNAETGEDIKDEGQTKLPGENPADKRSAVESAQVERESRGNIRKASEEYNKAKASVGQLNASIDAAKDGNGLVTSFVPTMEVLGINAAQGVHRISPAEAEAAQLPGGFVERFNAWFDKAATGQLSPQLQAEGKQLGQILLKTAYGKYKSTYDQENSIVSGYGGTGFDKRVPLIPEERGGGGNQKTLSRAAIQQAAKDHNISEQQAEAAAKAQGYTIQ